MHFSGYAAHKQGAALKPLDYEPGPLGDHEVEIEITHCGICHSDIHLIDNDWDMSSFPFIPGHEIVGTVTGVGSHVKHLKPGNRAGIGWQAGSCHDCEWCISGDEQLCSEHQPTCVGRNGGFADRIRADARFAFNIPEELASENAAPLLCGGITVYTPLVDYGVKSGDRVAVVGIGGLGHLALQYAGAWGCHVTALSTSPSKEEEARGFGAHEFINTKEDGWAKRNAGSFDHVISTISADLDWPQYFQLVRPKGSLILVGASQNPVGLPGMALVSGARRIGGSMIGGRRLINDMLRFSARHNIAAKTEVLPLSEVNAALDKVRNNSARYRMVLKMK